VGAARRDRRYLRRRHGVSRGRSRRDTVRATTRGGLQSARDARSDCGRGIGHHHQPRTAPALSHVSDVRTGYSLPAGAGAHVSRAVGVHAARDLPLSARRPKLDTITFLLKETSQVRRPLRVPGLVGFRVCSSDPILPVPGVRERIVHRLFTELPWHPRCGLSHSLLLT